LHSRAEPGGERRQHRRRARAARARRDRDRTHPGGNAGAPSAGCLPVSASWGGST